MKRIGGRAIYAGTIIAIFGLVAGFVAASIAINTSNQSAEGNYISPTGSVPGLFYNASILAPIVSAPAMQPAGSQSTPVTLVTGENDVCLSAQTACTNGNLSETINYTFTASLQGSIQISVDVIANSTISGTLYFAAASPGTTGSIVIWVDLGTSNILQSVSLTAQECLSASCP